MPTTQSADLRAYYSKHTKNDRLDSTLLARLPLLHPEGLRAHTGHGPADPLRRAAKQRSSIVKRRTAVFARIDALLELLGPGWYEELGTDYGNAAMHLLARYADPNDLIRLGPSPTGPVPDSLLPRSVARAQGRRPARGRPAVPGPVGPRRDGLRRSWPPTSPSRPSRRCS